MFILIQMFIHVFGFSVSVDQQVERDVNNTKVNSVIPSKQMMCRNLNARLSVLKKSLNA